MSELSQNIYQECYWLMIAMLTIRCYLDSIYGVSASVCNVLITLNGLVEWYGQYSEGLWFGTVKVIGCHGYNEVL